MCSSNDAGFKEFTVLLWNVWFVEGMPSAASLQQGELPRLQWKLGEERNHLFM